MMYIGFSVLEKLIAKVESCHTLYLTLLDEIIPGADGIDWFRCELMIQMPTRDGLEPLVLYWKMTIGQALAPGGTPFPEDLEKIKTRGKSALEAVRQYLSAQAQARLIEEGAVIAMPRGLKLLRGQAHCLALDRQSGTFHLKEGRLQGQTQAVGQKQEVGSVFAG